MSFQKSIHDFSKLVTAGYKIVATTLLGFYLIREAIEFERRRRATRRAASDGPEPKP